MPPELRQAVTETIEAAPPPRGVEEVRAMLEGTEKGGVRNSIHNCLTVFQYDPVLSGAVAKNLLTERIDPVSYTHLRLKWADFCLRRHHAENAEKEEAGTVLLPQ